MNKGEFSFIPRRAYFEREALEYQLGKEIHQALEEMGVEIKLAGSHNRITGIPGKTPREAYQEGKNTMVVGVRKTLEFQTCKPSAHFQLPLATSCPGMCQYCYLNTTLGKKPYIRVYVNIDQILDKAKEYITSREPEITIFEGAATSDPLPVEPYTGALAKAINYFGIQEMGRFRFVTKFTNVDSLLKLEHKGHTRFRFSLNAPTVIDRYEQRTPRLLQRLEAARKVYQAGYPTGFIVAPIIEYEGWQEEYRAVFSELRKRFGSGEQLTIELITHRFTQRAKNNILDIFPETTLPMVEENRKFKYGQFGYGKYVYPPEKMAEIKTFLQDMVDQSIPQAAVEYFV
ncbi:spore photoproduct lyase [Peptococcaceae bacterium DYL19]|nr:spore photoproduct lyase [Phosphitispora fastidiosa]